MLNESINRTAAQDLKTKRSVKCKLGFIFLHMFKKTRLFNIFQKMLHVALPVNISRKEALSEPVNWQLLLLPESILCLVSWKVSTCQRQRQNIGLPFCRTNELLFPAKRAQKWYLCFWGLLKAINGVIKWFFAEFSSRSLTLNKTNVWEWTASKTRSMQSDCV